MGDEALDVWVSPFSSQYAYFQWKNAQKKRVKLEGQYPAFVRHKESLKHCHPGWSAERVWVEAMKMFPPLSAASEGGSLRKPSGSQPSVRLGVDELDGLRRHFEGKSAAPMDAVRWVAGNLYLGDHVDFTSAPSTEAVGLFKWALYDPGKFWAQWGSQVTPSRRSAAQADKRAQSVDRINDLIDAASEALVDA